MWAGMRCAVRGAGCGVRGAGCGVRAGVRIVGWYDAATGWDRTGSDGMQCVDWMGSELRAYGLVRIQRVATFICGMMPGIEFVPVIEKDCKYSK